MRCGFVTPDFPGEKRVALLPEHIGDFDNELWVEAGFGANLGIPDSAYAARGCTIATRDEIFSVCSAIFSLKLIQPADYGRLRDGHMIVGWTHPSGSGARFMAEQARPKNLVIVDLDNIAPRVYTRTGSFPIDWIPANFVWRNSWTAGYAAVQHAFIQYGLLPDSRTRIAVLSAGNVAQGAIAALNRMGADMRIFTRKTMDEFRAQLDSWDVIVSGIEMDRPDAHILTRDDLSRLRPGTLVIDAAADAGNAIEGTRYASIESPLYVERGIYFYVVGNAPSIFFRNASEIISESFSHHVYRRDMADFLSLLG